MNVSFHTSFSHVSTMFRFGRSSSPCVHTYLYIHDHVPFLNFIFSHQSRVQITECDCPLPFLSPFDHLPASTSIEIQKNTHRCKTTWQHECVLVLNNLRKQIKKNKHPTRSENKPTTTKKTTPQQTTPTYHK